MENEYLSALIWIKGYLEGLQNLKTIPSGKIENLILEISHLLDLNISSVEELKDDLPF